jgi:hypothetical protein
MGNHGIVFPKGVQTMRIKKFVLALAVGATATTAWADSPSGSAATTPTLPLPEMSTTWNTGAPSQGVVSTSYTAPTGSSWDQNPQAPAGHQDSTPANPIADGGQPVSVDPMASPASEPNCGCASPSKCGCGCGGFGGEFGGCGCGCCCNSWYGYAGGLIMTRNEANKYWTTYNQASNADQVLNTANASAGWAGGAEFTFGRTFCCDNKIDVTYWGVWQLKGSASVTDPASNLGTPLDTTNGGLTLNGQTADSFYASSHETLIQRSDQVNNIEINWSYNPTAADKSCGISSTWLAGFRYFRFGEDLLWTSVAHDDTFGEDGGADQAVLQFKCKNDLAGFQVGNRLDWKINNCLTLFGGAKGGIYGNDASTVASWYTGSGVNGFTYTGHKDDVAFLGQADVGLNYDFNCRWSATLGYRVVAATGIALADNQIPAFLAAQSDMQDVKTNGDLVLHGGFAGLQFCW